MRFKLEKCPETGSNQRFEDIREKRTAVSQESYSRELAPKIDYNAPFERRQPPSTAAYSDLDMSRSRPPVPPGSNYAVSRNEQTRIEKPPSFAQERLDYDRQAGYNSDYASTKKYERMVPERERPVPEKNIATFEPRDMK